MDQGCGGDVIDEALNLYSRPGRTTEGEIVALLTDLRQLCRAEGLSLERCVKKSAKPVVEVVARIA